MWPLYIETKMSIKRHFRLEERLNAANVELQRLRNPANPDGSEQVLVIQLRNYACIDDAYYAM